MLVVVPVSQHNRELVVVCVSFGRVVDDDGGTEAVDVVSRGVLYWTCEKSNAAEPNIRAYSMDPVGTPLSAAGDVDIVGECLTGRDAAAPGASADGSVPCLPTD